MPDILFIVVLALVIFGPKRLPEIARQLAKLMAQFRSLRNDLQHQLNSELLKIELEEKQKELQPTPQLPAAAPAREALPSDPALP